MSNESRDSEVAVIESLPKSSSYVQIASWLDTNDWTYSDYPENGYFSIGFNGTNGSWRVVIDVQEYDQGEKILIYSMYPIRVPALRLQAISELLARANYGMTLGNFELDWKDGEVRLKTSLDLAGDTWSERMFEKIFSTNLGTANRYMAAIYGVAFGDVSPQLAIEVAERPQNETLQ
jgi:hypothetical protein